MGDMMNPLLVQMTRAVDKQIVEMGRTKSLAWRHEFFDYFVSATSGRNEDWASFDADATAAVMIHMWKDNDHKSLEEYRVSIVAAIITLMLNAAKKHTDQCEKNGTLSEDES